MAISFTSQVLNEQVLMLIRKRPKSDTQNNSVHFFSINGDNAAVNLILVFADKNKTAFFQSNETNDTGTIIKDENGNTEHSLAHEIAKSNYPHLNENNVHCHLEIGSQAGAALIGTILATNNLIELIDSARLSFELWNRTNDANPDDNNTQERKAMINIAGKKRNGDDYGDAYKFLSKNIE
ncbi:hypothetical protein [Metapseudomonas otitidis]|uniref:hypothetical protein n=1 Tax=Metapseudomonas otitidis TaxID=319939 RepID=UPI0013F5F248|nr:hypothetical protein [Pseudomonas otitidis]